MSAIFHALKIIDICRETEDSIVLSLEPEAGSAPDFAFLPGQHLILRADIDGEEIRRNYSICVPKGSDVLKVGIKKVEGGRFSSWATTSLKPGDTIEAMTPRGHFTASFSSVAQRSYLAIAGGSGITPILSLIATGLAEEPDSRFTLLYGNRNSASVMFMEEIAGLKDRYLDRLQLCHFLDEEVTDVEFLNGRLDAARLADALRYLIDPGQIDQVFICGPGPMMDAAERALADAGVAPDRILLERFTAGRPTAAAEQAGRNAARSAEGTEMRITIDGRQRRVPFQDGKGSILESARAAGLGAPFACKAGVCATCRARLVSGRVHMASNYGLSAEEIAQGYILTCQAVPTTPDVALDYDG